MKTFKELGLSDAFISILKKNKIEKPTEIQEKTIPLLLKGNDLIGGSATGSGKTLTFSAPIVENLKPNGHVQALILTPTRELAEQISTAIKSFSENKKLQTLAIYGGVNISTQIRKIHKTDIVIGTPGRILDHLNRRTLSLRKIKYLVLDEADRMFDMGFYKDVEKIMRECPKEKQTMLFSATISEDVHHLAKRYTKNPKTVSVNSQVDPSKLKQIYYDVDDRDKFSLLIHFLKKEKSDLVLVFCSTRKNVDFVTENLIAQKIGAKAIHGGMEQKRRTKTLEDFHKKGIRVLVCTDVAARGLDIKDVSHVYNYDLPKTSEEYIHRIGRTARAGEKGQAISILCSRDYENFGNIERDEKLKISPKEAPKFERVWVNTKALTRDKRNSGSNFRRPQRRNDNASRNNGPKRSFGKRTFDRDAPRGKYGSNFKKRRSGGGSRRNIRSNSKGRNQGSRRW